VGCRRNFSIFITQIAWSGVGGGAGPFSYLSGGGRRWLAGKVIPSFRTISLAGRGLIISKNARTLRFMFGKRSTKERGNLDPLPLRGRGAPLAPCGGERGSHDPGNQGRGGHPRGRINNKGSRQGRQSLVRKEDGYHF